MSCPSITQSILLDALHCQNHHHRPPVWLMRQAGRYMPSYQEIKKKYSLDEMFRNEELIVEVSLLPVKELQVDAAIIFSDILLILESLGFSVSYPIGHGPLITPKLHQLSDIGKYQFSGITPTLEKVIQSIKILKKNLQVPLIGFAGAPFSLFTYIVEEDHRSDLRKTKEWLYTNPSKAHQLLDVLTDATIKYLKEQIKAGVDIIQIFDSWAGILAYSEFKEFSIRYLEKIMGTLKRYSIPVILFARGSSYYLKDFLELHPSAISLDWLLPLDQLKKVIPMNVAVQGNLDPHLLLGSEPMIRTKTLELLHLMKDHPGFVLNLGHGVLPMTPYQNVQYFVDTVKAFNGILGN